jgi:mannose-6-phosphate isomerase-like protein (cupin superfamily)
MPRPGHRRPARPDAKDQTIMSANETKPDELDIDVIRLARQSEEFRRVLLTGSNMQVVVMTLPPGEEIGEETHEHGDQMLFFVDGRGEAVLEGETTLVEAGHLVFVPAGTLHNFINTGDDPLRIVTAYAPPEHEHGTVHHTRQDAEADEHDH